MEDRHLFLECVHQHLQENKAGRLSWVELLPKLQELKLSSIFKTPKDGATYLRNQTAFFSKEFSKTLPSTPKNIELFEKCAKLVQEIKSMKPSVYHRKNSSNINLFSNNR